MPASVKLTSEVTAILAGHGDVGLEAALAALATAPGIAYAVKKLHIKLTPVEEREIELLDADMPAGWWRRFKDVMPAIAKMDGGPPHRLFWHKGHWSVGTEGNDVLITTPMLDEETGELVS